MFDLTGRKALVLGRRPNACIHGLSLADSEETLDRLWEHATQPELTWYQEWRVGDAVMWDNRCTLHRATPLETDEYKRDVRRATVNEYGPEVSAAATPD